MNVRTSWTKPGEEDEDVSVINGNCVYQMIGSQRMVWTFSDTIPMLMNRSAKMKIPQCWAVVVLADVHKSVLK